MDLSLVQGREYKDTFPGGNYDIDVEVSVGLRLSAIKAKPETKDEILHLFLKTDRQKELYEDIQKRCKTQRADSL